MKILFLYPLVCLLGIGILSSQSVNTEDSVQMTSSGHHPNNAELVEDAQSEVSHQPTAATITQTKAAFTRN